MKNKKRYYYLYKITNLNNGMIYIGVRTTTRPKDNYWGSGTNIIEAIKTEGRQNFKKEILEYFKTAKKCLDRERDIVNEEFIAREDTYNIILGGGSFGTIGCVVVKDKFGNIFMVNKKDSRYLNGELISVNAGLNAGKIVVKDIFGKKFKVNKNDKGLLNGDLVPHTSKNMVPAIDKNGKKTIVTKEEYYKRNDLTTNNSNKIAVRDNAGNTFLIDKNDPRYLKGKVQSVHKGKILAKNKSGKIVFVTREDFINNKLVGINKNIISGSRNPMAKTIKIYNSNNKLIYTCIGNFEETCKKYNLPLFQLFKSYRKNIKIYSTKAGLTEAKKSGNYKYIGWYAKMQK